MTFARNSVFVVLLLTLAVAVGSRANAQEQEEFGGRPEKIFQLPPQTPYRLVKAAHSAARLNYTQSARGYLQTLIDRQLADDDLLKLREQAGLQVLLSLNANADLQPMSGQLLRQINEASAAAIVSADQAAQLVAQLGASPEQTVAAGTKLMTLGNAGASALLMADTSTESGRLAYDLLRRHPRQFRFGVLESLPDANADQQSRGLAVLAASADATLAPLLLEYEFGSDSERVRESAARAVNLLWAGDNRPQSADAAVEWLTRQAAALLASAADRFSAGFGDALAQATRLAQVATAIDQHSQPAAAVQLACEAATGNATETDVAANIRQQALQVALHAQHSTAVTALMDSDSDRLREATLLPGAVARVTASAELLKSAERVRGAAFARIVLRHAAQGSTAPEAVVIDPRLEIATEAVWLLQDQGYNAVPALTGQAGFERAIRQLSCELILIHSNCVRWPLSQAVANLRGDSRTAQTPIAVYGPRRDHAAIRQLQQRYPGVYLLPGPLSAINFVDELRRNEIPGPMLSEETRSRLIELATTTMQAER